MSSSRAKTLSDEYRFVSGLVLREYSRPCQARTTAGSGQVTIGELNARDFHTFEAAIPPLSGAFDRLDEAARDQVSSDEEDFGNHPSGSPFTRIEAGLGNFLKWFSSLIPSRNQSQAVPEPDHGRDADDVEDMIQGVVETGTLDSDVRQILALCIQKPREAVDAWTEVNKMVEIEMLHPGGPRPAEMSERDTPNRIVTEVADSRTPSEVLFDHLALRSGCHEKHHAWLQLSGLDMSQDQAEFHMFLSCCNIGAKYHETRCTHARYPAPLGQQAPSPLNVCTQAKEAHEEYIPLLLSFNSSEMWPTNRGVHLLHNRTPEHLSLEFLLQVGQLKSTSPDAMLQKYRLARQLASSLYHLYPGPWVQHNLTAKDIFVFHDRTADPSEKLDEPHVHCLLQKGCKLTNPVAEAFKRYGSDRFCMFFLSFAQLLVDIAKGKPGPHPSCDSPLSWYQALADEAEETFSDEIVKHYKKAIEGCLLYLRHYKSEETRTTNAVLRAREVIYQKILSPLQKNLSHWEKEVARQGKSIDNEDEEENSTVVGQAQGRSTVEFTLFSDENGQYPVWPDTIPARAPDERDFTVCMAKYIAKFIQPPPLDKFEYVKVAIIDTGFYTDEDDYFLQGAEGRVKERKSFVGPHDDWMDREGHGTQVARLLLKHAPGADIYIAKISNSHTLGETRVDRLVEALEWAGTQADIINLSFGLGQNCLSGLGNAIDDLVSKNKLIFAAASNCGGNGSRPWPANQLGVFCIHTTNERGVTNQNMNPFAVKKQDNFATLGENIESFWDGEKRCISGTSFATPIAAAIAANVLHFARKHLEKEDADELMKYKVMRILMRKLSKQSDSHHDYINPWNTGLWTQDASDEEAAGMLKRIVTYLE